MLRSNVLQSEPFCADTYQYNFYYICLLIVPEVGSSGCTPQGRRPNTRYRYPAHAYLLVLSPVSRDEGQLLLTVGDQGGKIL